jgi:hypothetical protein
MSPVICANPKSFFTPRRSSGEKPRKTKAKGKMRVPRHHPHEAAAIAFVAAVPAMVHEKNTMALRPVKARGAISGCKWLNG